MALLNRWGVSHAVIVRGLRSPYCTRIIRMDRVQDTTRDNKARFANSQLWGGGATYFYASAMEDALTFDGRKYKWIVRHTSEDLNQAYDMSYIYTTGTRYTAVTTCILPMLGKYRDITVPVSVLLRYLLTEDVEAEVDCKYIGTGAINYRYDEINAKYMRTLGKFYLRDPEVSEQRLADYIVDVILRDHNGKF